MTHNATINSIAWILAISGCVALIASSVGAVYCLTTMGSRNPAELVSVDLHLHDSYYVIRHSRFIIWPFLLCMSLSAALMILGYVYTNLHISRLMRESVSSSARSDRSR